MTPAWRGMPLVLRYLKRWARVRRITAGRHWQGGNVYFYTCADAIAADFGGHEGETALERGNRIHREFERTYRAAELLRPIEPAEVKPLSWNEVKATPLQIMQDITAMLGTGIAGPPTMSIRAAFEQTVAELETGGILVDDPEPVE